MKAIFVGTPQVAADYLKILAKELEITLVITQSPKESGRGLKVRRSPVALTAEALKIELLEVSDINDSEVARKLSRSLAEIGIVIAFGQLIKPATLDTLKYGFINLHFSLLPEFRGADPVAAAIRTGTAKTGVSVFKIGEGLDSGPVYVSSEIDIDVEENTQSLFEKMFPIGLKAIFEAIKKIEANEAPKEQIGEVSYAPKIYKKDLKIAWEKSSQEIYNLIRSGVSGRSAWTWLDSKMLKITAARLSNAEDFGQMGEVRIKDKVYVQTGLGVIEILQIVPEGKPEMTAVEWSRGLKNTKVIFK